MNSRRITLQKSIRYFFAALFWLPVAFFTLLLIRNTIPYFSFNQSFSFIEERAALFAKGSYWERLLFMFMAVYWFYTTVNGYIPCISYPFLLCGGG